MTNVIVTLQQSHVIDDYWRRCDVTTTPSTHSDVKLVEVEGGDD